MIDDADFAHVAADTIRFERLLPGPIERVWEYLTRRELLASWFDAIDVPAQAGATFTHHWDPADPAGGVLTGTVLVFTPPHVLEYTWTETGITDGPIRDSVVRFELTTDGDRVRLVLTHRAIDARFFSSLGPGWHAFVDNLVAVLSGRPAADATARYQALRPLYEARLADVRR
jgi:uncharacterized protein YndB with AHSA1/START domain